MRRESGFTLIELLIVIAILGILSSLMMTSFWIYKERAEYAKAQTLLHQAKTAFEVGDQDAAPGHTMPLQTSATDGSSLAGPLSDMLPALVMPDQVQLSAIYASCANGAPMQLAQFLSINPCKATRRMQWTRFCNGVEIHLEGIPSVGC